MVCESVCRHITGFLALLNMNKLTSTFFARDTLLVAPDLIGKLLVHDQASGQRLAGWVVETEAYTQDDPAFRGWGMVMDAATGLIKPEGRTHALFGKPGTAYVYKCYNHWLLNVVTEPEGRAGAVLIRAVEPTQGQHAMYERRAAARRDRDLTNGPGKLTQAFGVDGSFHNRFLPDAALYLMEADAAPDYAIATSARIGLNFGIDLQYRFFAKGNSYVSPGVPSDVAAARRRR